VYHVDVLAFRHRTQPEGELMNDTTVSYDASDRCPRCGSTNWLVDQSDEPKLHAERPTNRNERACNDCGRVWPA